MTTTPGQLIAQMRERFTPAADAVCDEIEAHMKGLTGLDSDGSFEFATKHQAAVNPTVLAILAERYGRPDGSGWTVAFQEPNLIELVPQTKPHPAH